MTERSWLSMINNIFFVQSYRGSVIRRSSDEPVRVENRQQIVKCRKKCFGVFFTASVPGSLVPVDGMMHSSNYIEILKSRIVPFLQTFPDDKETFQHDLGQCHNLKSNQEVHS
jgi:hypothetical protein